MFAIIAGYLPNDGYIKKRKNMFTTSTIKSIYLKVKNKTIMSSITIFFNIVVQIPASIVLTRKSFEGRRNFQKERLETVYSYILCDYHNSRENLKGSIPDH